MDRHGSFRSRRGVAIILTALMLTVILPIVGLTIDVGIMYAVRARLSAACDAAALAAARSLATGITLADQEATAQKRAEAFFAANFTTGMLDTRDRKVSVKVAESSALVRTVTVTGTVATPVYFMRALGAPRTYVSASGEASRRDVNVMMVLDRSGSLQTAGACDDLESAALAFSNLFANQRDRLGMITYGGAYRLDYAPIKNFKQAPAIADEIRKLDPGGCSGWTGSAQALWQGYTQLAKIGEPGALNVIVFFTDGQPNSITGEFAVKTQATPESATYSRCYDWEHGVSIEEKAWNPVNQRYFGYIAGGDWTDGIYQPAAPAMPVKEEREFVVTPSGYKDAVKAKIDCRYRSNSSKVVYDVAYYPDEDAYGNSLFGYKKVETFAAGHPYAGKVRTDPHSNLMNGAVNAVDNAADRIRKRDLDPAMPVTVYAVGLGGAGAAEHELLKRIANTKDSPVFDSAAPQGMYLYAPSSGQLGQAFAQIASEILRLSK